MGAKSMIRTRARLRGTTGRDPLHSDGEENAAPSAARKATLAHHILHTLSHSALTTLGADGAIYVHQKGRKEEDRKKG
jgi:hypothetical protein